VDDDLDSLHVERNKVKCILVGITYIRVIDSNYFLVGSSS